jgi:hypothetical protein
MATVGADQPAVLGQCVQRAGIDGHIQQPVACDIERHGIARGECNSPQGGGDLAIVSDIGTQQRNIAAIRVDRAVVLHRAAGSGEFVMARHEVGIADAEGRGHESADIHLGAFREHDAVRIDQEHVSVRRQIAKYRRGICTDNPIEGDRAAVRLHEIDGLAAADAEALPVDGDVLARLIDGEGVLRAGDFCAARRYHAACGKSPRGRGK